MTIHRLPRYTHRIAHLRNNTFVNGDTRCWCWEGGDDTPGLFQHLILREPDYILSGNILNAFDKTNAAELFLILVHLQK